MIEFIATVITNIVGLFIQFILADRYWGTRILGNIVQPKDVLIYESRPWWMKNIALFIAIGIFSSIILLCTFWLFLPFTIGSLTTPLITLWIIIILALGIDAVAEKTGGHKRMNDEIS